MPASTVYAGSPYPDNSLAGGADGPVGAGGTLGMPRTDGFTDGFDTIQGTRTYNTQNGNWTSPDAYPGIDRSPISQKSYLWNGDDPMDNMDPSGYFTMQSTPVDWGPDPTDTLWNNYLNALDTPASPQQQLKTIAHVIAICHGCRQPTPPQQPTQTAVPPSNDACTVSGDGIWSCGGGWGKLPNIMGAGQHPKCLETMMNPYAIGASSAGGGIAGGIVGGVWAGGSGGSVAAGIGGGFVAGSVGTGGSVLFGAVLTGGIVDYTGIPAGPWGSGC
jgi:hypothetical protein